MPLRQGEEVPVLKVGEAVTVSFPLNTEMDSDAVLRRDELAADTEVTEEAADDASEMEETADDAPEREAVENERIVERDVTPEEGRLRRLELADAVDSEVDATEENEADATVDDEVDTMLETTLETDDGWKVGEEAGPLVGTETTLDGAVEVSGWVKNDVSDSELAAETEDASRRVYKPCSP
ncbi:hypothetical protein EIP86_006921 [Pleurotus ostreatoroseus]|nr:hypothetical protein EIP86_006921 [Pleurotus ostreatoroseus]